MTMPGKKPNTCSLWRKMYSLLALGLALGLNRAAPLAAEAAEAPAANPAGVPAPALARRATFRSSTGGCGWPRRAAVSTGIGHP